MLTLGTKGCEDQHHSMIFPLSQPMVQSHGKEKSTSLSKGLGHGTKCKAYGRPLFWLKQPIWMVLPQNPDVQQTLSISRHLRFHVTGSYVLWHGQSQSHWPSVKRSKTTTRFSTNERIQNAVAMVLAHSRKTCPSSTWVLFNQVSKFFIFHWSNTHL